MLATITIGVDPYIELGPLTLAWHGLTIAIGILIGTLLAERLVRAWGLPSEAIFNAAALAAAGGLIGGRALYVIEHGLLDQPSEWISTRGFSFNGGLALAAAAIAGYVWRRALPLRSLDAMAVALPLGVAVGRIGDVINGEHYGPPTDFFLGVRNTHPDASVPSPDVAYHSGGLYDLIIALAVFAVAWPLRNRLRRPTALVWLVLGLFGAGRFLEFFARSDSQPAALGLSSAQWTSLAVIAIAVVGGLASARVARADGRHRAARSAT